MSFPNLRSFLSTSVLAVAAVTAAPQAHAYQADLLRCVTTSFATTGLGTCGGDNLTAGQIGISPGGVVGVKVRGALADPFNLYEVYWLPIGSSVINAVYVGNFATNCSGRANQPLKQIVTPADVPGPGGALDINTLVGSASAGNFLVYSRGPWATSTDADCAPETFNTTVSPTDTDPNNPLANPTVNLTTDAVQFISGYEN